MYGTKKMTKNAKIKDKTNYCLAEKKVGRLFSVDDDGLIIENNRFQS